jgi:predicted GNAT family N-acyltransferase
VIYLKGSIKQLLGDKNVVYRVGRTQEDLDNIRNLRYQVFGLEAVPPYIHSIDDVSDVYDDVAVNILAEYDADPAGSLRILDQRNLKRLRGRDGTSTDEFGNVIFPMEKEQPDVGKEIRDMYKNGRNIIVIERLVVPKKYSGNGSAKGLFANCLSYVKKTDVDDTFILVNCEMHSRGRDDIPEEERAKIPGVYKRIGFEAITPIFWYDDFNAHAAIMHIPSERVSKRLRLFTKIKELNGGIADFDICPEKMPTGWDRTLPYPVKTYYG